MDSTTAKKRSCLQWKKDDSSIPLKTRQRWQKNVQNTATSSVLSENIHDDENDDFGTNDSDQQSIDENDSDQQSIDENEFENASSAEEIDEQDECNENEDNISGMNGNQSSLVVKKLMHLHENSDLMVSDAVLGLMELYIKHKLTQSCLTDLLKFVKLIMPSFHNMPETKFKLFKYVEEKASSCIIIKHFYCKICSFYFGSEPEEVEECPQCNHHFDKKTVHPNFFELDIIQQIRHLFEKENLGDKIIKPVQKSDGSVSDIVDGSEYIRTNNRSGRKEYDLTLILNTDGISLSKSSTTHCWPLMAMIAELPPHLRESNILILGLWFDETHKPIMNNFLRPFCEKLNTCFHEGIKWYDALNQKDQCTKIVAPLFVADAPARASLLNILNFNGRNGCPTCEIETKQCELPGVKKFRAYIHDENPIVLRTSKRMLNQVEELSKNWKKGKNVIGVKGPSIIAYLPLLDMGTCCIPEYMHSVLLGVVKQIACLWFTKPGEWYIGNSVKEVDRFLIEVNPPNIFHRMPRKISKFKQYKAYEFLNWLLFYSIPAVHPYLPAKFFQHWLLLVIGLFNLLKDTITSSDLQEAETVLDSFVSEFKILYGEKECTYNVHQLLHLTLSVRRWGPLWCNSAFPFENQNGVLTGCVHGHKHMGQEISNFLNIARGVQALKLEKNNTMKPKNIDSCGDFQLLNEVTCKYELNEMEMQVFSNNGISSEDTIRIFSRAKIKNNLYTSQLYRKIKTNSHTIQCATGNYDVIYGSIKFFFQTATEMGFCLQTISVKNTEILFHRETRKQLRHVLPFDFNEECVIIKFSNMKSLKYLIQVGNYVCKLPNMHKIL